tara:strand:- start:343 stop:570 length:228 start_codon:yes stop_codon:yes gene_type:complete
MEKKIDNRIGGRGHYSNLKIEPFGKHFDKELWEDCTYNKPSKDYEKEFQKKYHTTNDRRHDNRFDLHYRFYKDVK